MKGRKETFSVGSEAVSLSRPAFSEMHGFMPRVASLITETHTANLANGGLSDLLLEAASTPEDRTKLEAFLAEADYQDVMSLWDDYIAFGGFADFLASRESKRIATLLEARANELKLLRDRGLIDQDYIEAIISATMLPSQGFTGSTPANADGRQLS